MTKAESVNASFFGETQKARIDALPSQARSTVVVFNHVRQHRLAAQLSTACCDPKEKAA